MSGQALRLWRNALADGLDPAANVIWTSAISLASAARPSVYLLALNSVRCPRQISEDRMIPDHVVPIEELDPLPVADGDRRDFLTILSSSRPAAISFSRRGAGGRLLGKSPLIARGFNEIYLSRGRMPEHAASEADQLLARPSEFGRSPIAVSGGGCWRDWSRSEIPAHDGLVGGGGSRLQKMFQRPLSATFLRLLLRDPIRFVWRYALGWKQPEETEEPLTLDPMTFGNLVHGILQEAVNALETAGGFGRVSLAKREKAFIEAVASAAGAWEREQPTPPLIIWRATLETAKRLALVALAYPLDPLPGQKAGRNYFLEGRTHRCTASGLDPFSKWWGAGRCLRGASRRHYTDDFKRKAGGC